jgi:hypothetical protein
MKKEIKFPIAFIKSQKKTHFPPRPHPRNNPLESLILKKNHKKTPTPSSIPSPPINNPFIRKEMKKS